MALILDFTVLEELNLSANELLFLYYLDRGEPGEEVCGIDMEDLESKGFVKLTEIDHKLHIEIRQKSLDLLQLLIVDAKIDINNTTIIKKSSRAINQELEGRLTEFRDKWKGLKPGSMGSLQSCKAKLTRWMKENPEYTFDEILKAADMYIASLNGDFRFLQRADYFVFKQENNREESSRLSAFIDEIDEYTPENWTSSLN